MTTSADREVSGAPIHLRALPFVVATAVATALVMSAPFVGQFRSYLRATFPGHFVTIVGGVVALGAIVAVTAALFRIRTNRARRYAVLAAAVVIAVGYSAWTAGPNPESNAVERFHFLQYGLIAFLFYRAWRPLGDPAVLLMPVLAGLIVGSAEEWLQWFIPNRVGELKDVFLNLVAVGAGLLFSLGLDPPVSFRRGLAPGSSRRFGRMSAAALIVFAAFFGVVHLGYEIEDPEIGTFDSRYPGERLAELQRARAEQWKLAPPTTLVRLSQEDQYLTEGIQHVRHRNTLWEASDVRGAWLENRILEKYYAPVLVTPTYAGQSGHMWPPQQRADAEVRANAAAGSGRYVSEAYPYLVFHWPKRVFWVGVLGVVAVILIASARADRTRDVEER